jgi:hypothetical protein
VTLIFYPKSHRYKLDGQWVTGVTTLIKNGYPNHTLKYWSARHVAEYVADHPEDVETLRRMGRAPMVAALKETPWEKRDVAAAKGTEVHELAERLVHDEQVEIPDHLDGYVQSCVAFLDEWQPKTLLAERPCASRAHQWAGTFDAVFELPDGRIIIVDWKTTATGIYEETAFQLAAYAHAEFNLEVERPAPEDRPYGGTEMPMPEINEAWGVWLRRDSYEVIPVTGGLDQIYKEFRHIKFVAESAKRAKGNKTTPGYLGTPLDPPGDPA